LGSSSTYDDYDNEEGEEEAGYITAEQAEQLQAELAKALEEVKLLKS
jgi:hypothetical protein